MIPVCRQETKAPVQLPEVGAEVLAAERVQGSRCSNSYVEMRVGITFSDSISGSPQ